MPPAALCLSAVCLWACSVALLSIALATPHPVVGATASSPFTSPAQPGMFSSFPAAPSASDVDSMSRSLLPSTRFDALPPPQVVDLPWLCRPAAFVLAGRWLPWSTQRDRTSSIIFNYNPVRMIHPVTIVFGIDPRGAEDNSVFMLVEESTLGSAVVIPWGYVAGTIMRATNPADAGMIAALPSTYSYIRFDYNVDWRVETKKFDFTFTHGQCGMYKVNYRYNPIGVLRAIIPELVTNGQYMLPNGTLVVVRPPGYAVPTDPAAVPVDTQQPLFEAGAEESCKPTVFAHRKEWNCDRAFNSSHFLYTCMLPDGILYDSLQVSAASSFLSSSVTLNSDQTEESTVMGVMMNQESASLRFLPGHNVILLTTSFGSICSLTYTFDVVRREPSPGAPPVKDWYAGEWTECINSCANIDSTEGEKTRTVECRNEAQQPLPEAQCDAQFRPESRQTCDATCEASTNLAPVAQTNSNAAPATYASPMTAVAASVVAILAAIWIS